MFEWRQQGTPFNQPCCGSVFKNPRGPSWKQEGGPRTAGQLIEAAGLKGFRIGGAEVSPMHANYFVNTGGATAADVRALIEQVQRRGAGAIRCAAGAGSEADRESRGISDQCHAETVKVNVSWVMRPVHFVQRDRSRHLHDMPDYFVHESSYVDDGAVIGTGTKIWHFCHVMPGAVIGERCNLGQNVVVMPGTRLGNNVKVQNNVSIYEGVDAGGRRLLRAELRVHQRGQSPEPRLPEVRVPADPGAPGKPRSAPTPPSSAASPSANTASSGPGRWSGATCRPTP